MKAPGETEGGYLEQAIMLERLRREIDDLLKEAGSLGDYIDRGHPDPVREKEAYATMERCRREAASKLLSFDPLVKRLRSDCPEIAMITGQRFMSPALRARPGKNSPQVERPSSPSLPTGWTVTWRWSTVSCARNPEDFEVALL
jgi:hypothetical protein